MLRKDDNDALEDEPRIPDGGQWTTGGSDDDTDDDAADRTRLVGWRYADNSGIEYSSAPAAAVGATAVAVSADSASSIYGPLGRTALAGLGDLAAGFAAPTAFLGVLFLPANTSLVTQGSVPGRPDLTYRYDRDTGTLQIYNQNGAGTSLVLSGHIGVNGLFYDASGGIIGRALGSTAVVDPEVLPSAPARANAAAEAGAAAIAKDRPQLCPDASTENTAGRSDRSLAYQSQISGLPVGLEVKLNGVRFDGCREDDGTMLEAKGPGFENKMNGPGEWRDWFTGDEDIEAQMVRQSGAAVGRTVEWQFAEQPVADYFREFSATYRLSNIMVFYTPAVSR